VHAYDPAGAGNLRCSGAPRPLIKLSQSGHYHRAAPRASRRRREHRAAGVRGQAVAPPHTQRWLGGGPVVEGAAVGFFALDLMAERRWRLFGD